LTARARRDARRQFALDRSIAFAIDDVIEGW